MKQLLKLAPAFCALLLLASFAPKSIQTSNSLVISSDNVTVTINGKSIATDFPLADLKSALGEPSRTKDGYNKTHTYDDMGIVLFETMEGANPSGNASEIQYYLSPPEEAKTITPTGTFKGSIKIDKLKLSKNITATKLLKKLSAWQKTASFIKHSYRLENKSLYIYFQFNNAENQLIKISFGKILLER